MPATDTMPMTDGRRERPQKTIRAPEFAKRLRQACDQAGDRCPPLHQGRLGWVAEEMGKLGTPVSNETVRKWLDGEASPRADKTLKLAQILEVDVAWLQMGYDPQATPKERKVRNAMASGAVNVIAGLIQLDGGHPAFPAADNDLVDLHAIIRGAKYDLHIVLGENEGRAARFAVPVSHENITILGVVRDGFAFDVFELTPEVIVNHGVRRGGSLEVSTDGAQLNRIESFAQRF